MRCRLLNHSLFQSKSHLRLIVAPPQIAMSQKKKGTLEGYYAVTSSPSKKRSAKDAGLTESAAKASRGDDGGDVSDSKEKKGAQGFDVKSLGLSPFAESIVEGLKDDRWREAMQGEFKKPKFKELMSFLEEETKTQTVFPPLNQIWTAFNLCHLNNVKVVILGQDPYFQKGQAHGLSFSVQPGVKVPPSLVNIYKELKEDIPGFKIPSHGYLSAWAERGVLLLNACLTVRQGKANSHAKKGWEVFTDAAIKEVSLECSHVVFLLWGAYAQKKESLIDTSKHLVLKSTHPSPLSAHTGWFGNHHFSKANEYLEKNGRGAIDWNLPTQI